MGVTGVSLVGSGEGVGLGAASAGEGVDGKVPGAAGMSLAPPVEGVVGVAGGASTEGDPPVGVAGISFSAALPMRPCPATEAPTMIKDSKTFEIFITYTLSFFVLSCETADTTPLNATQITN